MTATGRIGKLFGANGEVSINLYSNFPDNFNCEEQPLFIYMDSLVVPLFCETFVRRGVTGAVVRFADIDTPQRAEMIVGKEFFTEIGEESEDDEFCLEDLIGFSVRAGKLRGEITDFYDSDANPLFQITFDGKPHLIPAAEEFIASIDFEGRSMRLILPDGLLEL